MAFELKANERVCDGIARNVKNQIEKALRRLGAETQPVAKDAPMKDAPVKDAPAKDAIGEIRKCFKRVRAALRMVREEIGESFYHEENLCFRDAARPLTQVRDAVVLVETGDRMRQQFVQAIGPKAFTRIRAALVAHREEVRRRILHEGKAFASVADAANRALARLPDWRLQRDGWPAVEPGLRRVYRQAHRALALAAESPSVVNLHEWRKQTKYLWHQLQLLEATWADAGKELVDRTHQLATLLGEDHDLAVLRETLAADPLAYGGHHILKGVFAGIDRRRAELEQRAFALGREIFKDAPRAFTTRIQGMMHYQEAA